MEQHKPDWISATFGAVFVVLAVLLPVQDRLRWDFSEWVLPAAVLVLGVGIAVSAIASSRASR